jgi:hypothetical protein
VYCLDLFIGLKGVSKKTTKSILLVCVKNQDILGTVFPLVHPNWDPNSHTGDEWSQETLILTAERHLVRKTSGTE